MASKEKTVLGIDIDDSELRVVQIRSKGGKVTVLNTASTPLPMDSMYNGIVRQPGNVAVALTRLLDSHKISCKRAVLGICSEGSFVRTLAVPPVPEEELPVLVAGEINHYHVIRSRRGVYSFFPLAEKNGQEHATHVALFGAEEDTPRGLRDLADRVQLDIVALEPTSMAMLRVALQERSAAESNVLVVMVEHKTTDLACVRKGKVAFYRRIDIGLRAIIPDEEPVRGHAVVGGHAEEAGASDPGPAIEELSLDIRRSIEFLNREHKDDGPIDRVQVVVRHFGGEAFVASLQEQVAVPITLASVPNSISSSEPVPARFMGALGLALRDSDISGTLPQMDLFSAERSQYQMQSKKRNLAGSLVVSGLSLAGGVAGFVLFGMNAATIEAQTEKSQAIATKLRDAIKAEEAVTSEDLDAYKKIGAMSYATDLTIDAVARSLQPRVQLAEFRLTGGKADITLMAETEEAMIDTVDRITSNPLMRKVAFGSFERRQESQVLSFKINAEVRPMASVVTGK
jgi:Tfp pilus assembly PilM family ATPase